MKQQNFSLYHRIKSFGYAINGIKIIIREEHNFRIHLFAALCVLLAGILLKITTMEWIALMFAIGFVFTLEIVNTAIENMADFVSPDHHEMIKKIKDLSSAGVLVSAVTALVVGLLVFVPKLILLSKVINA